MIKSYRSFRINLFKSKKIKKIFSILSKLFICLILINFFSSDIIYSNLLQNFQTNGLSKKELPKTAATPSVFINLPINYSLHGKIAPDYSINITGGPGNYTWYEFLETSEKSAPIELNGLLNEVVNGTFNQNLWDNLSNGTVTIRFYANDSVNSIGFSDATIRIDTIAPETPIMLKSTPSSWANKDDFNLSWSNPLEPSGIIGAYYRLDSPPTSNDNGTYIAGSDIESITGITVGTEGNHTIYVWLIDTVGNIDYNNYATTNICLDVSDPGSPITLIANPSSWTNVDDFNLSWSNPLEPSGIIGAYYKLDSPPTSNDNGTYIAGSDIESITGITVGTEGNHTVYVWLMDAAGNIDYNNYATTNTYLDVSDPGSPITLIANPSSWTNVDDFNLSWSNPLEPSGIIGAYYKLDSPPTSNDNGTYIVGSDIESITGITVGTEGNHTVYVWLMDAAGNIDYNNYAMAYLCLDSSNPSSPLTLIANPSSWTNVDDFNISWANPSDTSGIVGAYYKLDSPPTSNDDGTYIAGVDIELITGITLGIEGNHTVYLWLVDAAGNMDYTTYTVSYLCLDVSDPSSPLIITATPSSWTNVDDFNISWTNPLDMSGIVGAYYKLDSPPTSNDNGLYVGGINIESITGITVATEGNHTVYVWLVDAAGNIDYNNYGMTYLCLDTANPDSPLTLTVHPSSWTNMDDFEISWTNPSDTSGIAGAVYKIDSPPTSNDNGTYVAGTDLESIAGITVGTEGNHTVYVWLVDSAGNVDYTTYTVSYLCLDTSNPDSPLTLISNPSSWTNVDDFEISWTNPSDTSGIVGAYYKLDSPPISNGNGTYIAGIDLESIAGITVGTEGNHTVYVWLVDSAGNVDYTTYTVSYLCLDTSNPDSPLTLISNPSSWTNVDDFEISWANPSDTSGIVGAYYKLDSPPNSNNNGTYIAGVDIESINGITVGAEGNHTVYVWLVDTAGNIDYNNYAMTYLCLDVSDPSSPLTITATPSSWTNVDDFDIFWTNPLDTSGIVGMYYKLGSPPTSNNNGTYIAGVDIELITGITVGIEGNHSVYVWLVDAAGNIDYTHYAIAYLCLDISNPDSPLTITANPSSWTNVDDFDIFWVNPSDMSGIVGAYYKLDSPPTSNDNGIYVAGVDLESISGITVGTEGNHTVYVWLVDSAGNVDYITYTVSYLCLDVSDPSSPLTLIANPSSWTNVDDFNISWVNPSDMSGIVGAYYKLDSPPTSNDNGIYLAGVDLESITGITVGIDGNHTVYVWLVDAAGNINHFNYSTIHLYLDLSIPLIFDLQDGDDIWRNIGGTTYDIDFFDSLPSSNLNYAQYKITSGTNQGGIILKDWTYIFNDLGENNYTTDWVIDFVACKEGINYISVRVYDVAGNSITINDTFYVKKDTNNPILVINAPINSTYCNVPPSINVTVFDLSLDFLFYTVIGYTPLINFLDNNTEVQLKQTIWDALPQGDFQILFTCYDELGQNVELTYTLYKDTMAPTLVINNPLNNTYCNSPPSLNITAFDPNLDSIWYSVNNNNITLINNTLTQLELSIWNVLPEEGEFQIKLFANDTFGYINDPFILTLYKDIISPRLTIISPINNSFWKTLPNIQVAAVDPYFDSLWYKVESYKISLFNNSIQQLSPGIWDNLPDECEFIIYFYANDTAGNLNQLYQLALNKDIVGPRITIYSPKNNDLFGIIAPAFNINIDDPNIDQTWYTLIGSSLNYSFSSWLGTIDQSAWEEFDNGTVTIRFYANDTLNNIVFKDVVIRKNIYAPVITIISPGDNDLFGIESPIFTIYTSGIELNTTWYTLNYGLINYTFTGLNPIINQTAWDNYGFGYVTIRFYINDSLGVIGFDEIILRKDPNPPIVAISYINPSSNGSYCNQEPTFRITVYEPNLLSIWYRVGTTDILISNNSVITLESSIWDNLPQGRFIIEIFAEDTLGYINKPLNLTFYKDTLAPRLIINNPNDQTYYNAPPSINITTFDPNFNSLTYTVIGYLPVNIWLQNNTEQLINQDIWDSLPQGAFLLSITAYDNFGHLNDTFILTLFKDTMAPVYEIVLPNNNSYHNSPPILKVSSNDPNLATIWYRVGSTSIELFNNTEEFLDFLIWEGRPEGVFTIEIFANDSFGQMSGPVNLNIIKDTTLPLITIFSPNNNTYYSSPPTMNIVASDGNLDTIWYTVMGTKITLPFGAEPLDTYIWNNLPQGEFQLLIFANDSAGNLNDNYIFTLFKDTLAPIIAVNSPKNNTFWNSRPILNVVAFDPNLESLSYKALGYSPLPLLNNTDVLFNSLIWTEMFEGAFIIEILAEDSFGNINSINLTIYKDTIVPEINIILPQPNGLFGSIAPNFDISITESYLNTTWYTLIGEMVNITFTGSTGSIDQTTWDKFGNGSVTIRFYANDTVGNLGYKDVIVRKDIFAPVITINSPSNDDLFGINAPDFIIYKSGPEIQATWYTLDNGLTNFTFTGLSGKIDQAKWDEYEYGIITIRFFVNNSLGKIGYDEVIIIKDPDAPIIFVNSPFNQTSFASAPFINLTIIEPHLHNVWYKIENTIIDLTDNLTQYLDSSLWNDLPQGNFILELFANDTLGNFNNVIQLYLSKDTVGPNITIITPVENQRVDRNAPFFELTLFDENDIEFSWYTINGDNSSIQFTGIVGRIDQDLWEEIWDNRTQGSVITITFYSMDKLGNLNYQKINLIKYQPTEPLRIFSNPLGFIFSTVSLGILAPITVKLTKSRYYKNLNKKEKSKLKKVLIAAFLLLSVTTLFYLF